MGIQGRFLAHGAEYIYLSWRIVQMVIAANDIRYSHIRIIDHHREIIGRCPVSAAQYQVVEFVVPVQDPATDDVINDHGSMKRIAKAHHVRFIRACLIFPAMTVIARLFLALHLRFAQ